LTDYIESEPQRSAAKAEAQRNELENLERKLGIDSSSSSKPGHPDAPADVLAMKHRFDDTEYLEKSQELKDNVKSAVSAALLKKKKKVKLSHPTEVSSVDSAENEEKEQEKKVDGKETMKTVDRSAASPVIPQVIAMDSVGA
jgi:hypothetical protein